MLEHAIHGAYGQHQQQDHAKQCSGQNNGQSERCALKGQPNCLQEQQGYGHYGGDQKEGTSELVNHLVILEVAALWGNFNQAGGAKHAIPRNSVKRVN
ncbi:hypothetical protein AERO8C_150197 [Aeromonas veronii]|uniref:Uncharacterized protein n=1 Tax=Aeromonas veronii TaxID=654 RepID=A0A653KWF9_AERVE|nr:hypothetical protein AERO8C_150197 [Aeromonas veronii]